jgi:hypothetical protein
MSSRSSLRVHPAIASAILVFCGAFFIWLVSFSPWKIVPFRVAGQAYLLIAILFAFRYWPPMVRFVLSMPMAHRIVFGGLIGAMLLGHYTLNGRTYFPFVVWEIFPFYREVDPVTAREFIATTADGTKVRLLAEQQVPSLVQINRIDEMPADTTERLARALAKIYNEHHASNPVQGVDLVLMAVPLHPPANESRTEPSCEFLNHYDISSAR